MPAILHVVSKKHRDVDVVMAIIHYKLISQPANEVQTGSFLRNETMVDRAISIIDAILCNQDLINTLANAIKLAK